MKRKLLFKSSRRLWRIPSKLLVLMKLSALLLTVACMQVSAAAVSQKISISVKNAPLEQVIKTIKKRSGYLLIYNNELLGKSLPVSVDIKEGSLEEVLDATFDGQPLTYSLLEHTIVVKRKTIRLSTEEVPLAIPPTEISGKVTDEKGNILPGVSIVIKGTQGGTTTNEKGNFLLTYPGKEAVLVFSFVGYISKEVAVTTQSALNVVLQVDVKALNEVVVIGYGTQAQKEVTGAIVTLQAGQLEDQPVGQIGQKIQGRMAGVEINQTTGKPGEGMAIRIRGAVSINASNTPLYVVDGFPIIGGINNINPNEIESFSVLKGAAAAAIYGSRASSGVIVITTKKAKKGQMVIDFSTVHGIASVPQRGRPNVMNAEEFAQYEKEIFEDRIKYEGYQGGVPEIYQNPSDYRNKSTDWYDVLLRKAPMSNYNLSISGSKDRFSSAVNLGYYKEDGVALNTGYERYSLRMNNEFKVNDFINVGLNLAPSFQTGQNFETDGAPNIFYAAITTPPIFSPFEKNPDGSLKMAFSGPGLFNLPNWYRTITEKTNRTNTTRLLSNAYAELTFLKDFKYKSAVSIDLINSNNKVFNPSTVGSAFGPPPQASASGSYSNSFTYSWLTENTLNYTKTLAENHNFEVLAGYSAQKYRNEYVSLSGSQFPDDAISWIDVAAVKNGSNNVGEWSLLSMYGRLNYNYKGKYIVSATARRDGSSRFGEDRQWGSFPSVSAGWVLSEENFIKKLPVLDYLKIRGEYGLTGNFNIGNYTQFANMGTANYVFGGKLNAGRVPTSLGNSQLTWETTGGVDAGLDLGLFGSRVFFTFDYYQNKTRGLLYQQDIPSGTGFYNIQSNIGQFKFWGYEFSVSTKNLTGNLKWNTDLNISFHRNKVVQLGTNNTPIGGITQQGGFQKTQVGMPIGMFWGWIFDGIYMTQEEFDTQPHHITSALGTARMKDLNEDGVIDEKDRTFLGNPAPKFVFGINNSFSYKNFDLNIVASGAYGGRIFNYQPAWTETLEGLFNVEKHMKDRWRSPENPGKGMIGRTLTGTTAFPRFDQDRFVYKNSYLTLKNITLGYTIPASNKIFKRVRAYVSVQQAFVLTNYPGNNPEVSIAGLSGGYGVDQASYPVPRTYSVGLNVSF